VQHACPWRWRSSTRLKTQGLGERPQQIIAFSLAFHADELNTSSELVRLERRDE
jgi:hypothetical protein